MSIQVERWRLADRMAFESAGDELVVLNLRSGEYYTLNAVAGEIWRSLAGSRTLREISEPLLRMYDVDRETLEVDLVELIEDLEKHGLLIREKS